LTREVLREKVIFEGKWSNVGTWCRAIQKLGTIANKGPRSKETKVSGAE
jgi:hypothetical protein